MMMLMVMTMLMVIVMRTSLLGFTLTLKIMIRRGVVGETLIFFGSDIFPFSHMP